MNSLQTFWNGLDWSVLTNMLLRVIPALLCITLHELCHGLTACWLGDDTAKRAGRLSLNPIRHFDPLGTLMMIAFGFGWAKPVPVNMYKFKNPKAGMAITAAAGPLSNLLLTLLTLFLYGLFYVPVARAYTGLGIFLLRTIYSTATLSLALAVFNVLPISPLDGSKVAFAFLGDSAYAKLMRYERYGIVLLIALSFTGILGGPLSAVIDWCMDCLKPVITLGYQLSGRLF